MLGVNISSAVKNKPASPLHGYPQRRQRYAPFGSLPFEAAACLLDEMNVGIVRQLLVLDEALGDDGAPREEYLGEFARTQHALKQCGYKVILDFHQDAFCRSLGGDGLPARYLGSPRESPVRLANGGKNWGALPIYSTAQRDAWLRFFENEAVQNAFFDDVETVVRFLAKTGNCAFDYIDLLNEPGCPDLFAGRALICSDAKERARERLINFYQRYIKRISAVLEELGLHPTLLIEPLNYDVSQIAYQQFGMGSEQLQPSSAAIKIGYAPHVYTPVPLCSFRKTLRNHLQAQINLGLDELIIGELGDLTCGTARGIARLEAQLHVLRDLDLAAIVWEFDVSQNSSRAMQNQDATAWNRERMSVVRGERLTDSGLVARRVMEPTGLDYQIAVGFRLSGSAFEDIRLLEFSAWVDPITGIEERYSYAVRLSLPNSLARARLEMLRRGGRLMRLNDTFILTSHEVPGLEARRLCYSEDKYIVIVM